MTQFEKIELLLKLILAISVFYLIYLWFKIIELNFN